MIKDVLAVETTRWSIKTGVSPVPTVVMGSAINPLNRFIGI